MTGPFDFDERLCWSKGVVAATCKETIAMLIPGCIDIRDTTRRMDKSGIDYVATLRRGATVNIDHKARDAGCSKWWKIGIDGQVEPQIAVELWSVRPSNGKLGVVGWTLDESKQTHYTLHTFDSTDSMNAYLLPFQLLRKAYRSRFTEWNDMYEHGIQRTERDGLRWQSECVFVPVERILSEIRNMMRLRDVIVRYKKGGTVQMTLFDDGDSNGHYEAKMASGAQSDAMSGMRPI